jgi:hypothetical protein
MALQPVRSSNVAAIEFLEAEEILIVSYIHGGVYVFNNFTAPDYERFTAAESKGKFLAGLRGAIDITSRGVRVGAAGKLADVVTANAALVGLTGNAALVGLSNVTRGPAVVLNFDEEIKKAQEKPAPDCSFSTSWK